MPRLALALTVLVFLVSACQPATSELTDADRALIEDALRAAHAEAAAAVNELDVERFLSFFASGEDFAFAELGKIERSWSAFSDTTRAHWGVLASVESFEWGELQIQILSKNAAVVTTSFDFSASDTAGNQFTASPTWTAVWLEQDGQWKMINVAETFPPPESM